MARWRDPRLWLGGALALLTLLLFARVVGFAFVWDDKNLIVQNPFLRQPDTLWRAFTSGFWQLTNVPRSGTMYRPLVIVSYWLELRVWDVNPAGYHVTNLVLHTLCAVLVFVLALRLELSPLAAAAAALLFAVHPVQSDAIGNIASRTDLLATAFALASTLCWLAPRPRPLAALALFSLGLLCKESVVTLPLIVGVLRWARGGVPRPERSELAALGVVGAYMLVRRAVLGAALRASAASSSWQGGMTFLRYAQRVLWPVEISPITTLPAPSFALALTSLATLIAVAVALVWAAASRPALRVALSLLLCAGIALLPSAEVLPLGARFSDLLLYWPLVFVMLALGVLASWRPALQLGLLAACASAFVTVQRVELWHDDLRLWRHAAMYAPEDPTVNLNLANALRASGKRDEGCRMLTRAFDLARASGSRDIAARASHNLGNCAVAAGRNSEAITLYQRALELSAGTHWGAFVNLVLAYQHDGQHEQAVRTAEQLTQRFPDNAEAWRVLAVSHAQRRDFGKARLALQRSLALNPNLPGGAAMLQRLEQDLARSPNPK